jgi:ABC-type multidrug transport system fused ATPase/permease subunit
MLPITFIFCFYYLFSILGLSFFSGIIVFLFSMLVNYVLSQKIKNLEKELSKCDDSRMNHTSEALNSIKTLKFY